MPTKGSKEQDSIVRRAMKDANSDCVEFATNKSRPIGPHHSGRGMIGGGSDTKDLVTDGPGHAGAADETGG